MMILAHSEANLRAAARPIHFDPPVTMIFFPEKRSDVDIMIKIKNIYVPCSFTLRFLVE